jgi:hypothetical protein
MNGEGHARKPADLGGMAVVRHGRAGRTEQTLWLHDGIVTAGRQVCAGSPSLACGCARVRRWRRRPDGRQANSGKARAARLGQLSPTAAAVPSAADLADLANDAVAHP